MTILKTYRISIIVLRYYRFELRIRTTLQNWVNYTSSHFIFYAYPFVYKQRHPSSKVTFKSLYTVNPNVTQLAQ